MANENMTVPKFIGNGKIEWETRPIPVPGPGQLLLRVKANSLCRSDRGQFYRGSNVPPGHEVMGIVADGGAGTTIKAGTHGVVFARDFCGTCRRCSRGDTSQCLHMRGVTGFTLHGGYDPNILVYENMFFPIDPDIAPAEATLLLDIMGTGSHALNRAQLVHRDIGSLLIAGAGPIGLGVLAMANIYYRGQLPVFITDFVPYRLELAQKLGAIPISLLQTTMEDGLKAHGFAKIDAVIDCSGKESARRSGLAALDRGGVLVCVGHGEGLTFQAEGDLIHPERTIMGSDYYNFGSLEENLQHLRNHLSYLSQIITHRVAGRRNRTSLPHVF